MSIPHAGVAQSSPESLLQRMERVRALSQPSIVGDGPPASGTPSRAPLQLRTGGPGTGCATGFRTLARRGGRSEHVEKAHGCLPSGAPLASWRRAGPGRRVLHPRHRADGGGPRARTGQRNSIHRADEKFDVVTPPAPTSRCHSCQHQVSPREIATGPFGCGVIVRSIWS